MPLEIPEVVVSRLPVYARALALLRRDGRELVSSQELGDQLGVTPAQIRKDLSYFGRFGKQGRGYNVRKLLDELQRILGLDRQWRMALVGVGKLGRAILGYERFAPPGFRIVQAFDTDPTRVGARRSHPYLALVPKNPPAPRLTRLRSDPATPLREAAPSGSGPGVPGRC